MALRACNNCSGPNGLTPSLLVFGAYPRMTENDPPAPTIAARQTAIHKAMAAVMKSRAQTTVNSALNISNVFSIKVLTDCESASL